MDYQWNITMVRDIVQKAMIKTIPKKKNSKRQNCFLKRPYKHLRKEVKGKGEKERYTHLDAEFQRIARRDKKAFLSDQSKKIKKIIEWERLEISSRKLEIPRAKKGIIQDRNGMDLTEAEDIKKSGKNTQKNYTKRA